jgi:hypothetical protein
LEGNDQECFGVCRVSHFNENPSCQEIGSKSADMEIRPHTLASMTIKTLNEISKITDHNSNVGEDLRRPA